MTRFEEGSNDDEGPDRRYRHSAEKGRELIFAVGMDGGGRSRGGAAESLGEIGGLDRQAARRVGGCDERDDAGEPGRGL